MCSSDLTVCLRPRRDRQAVSPYGGRPPSFHVRETQCQSHQMTRPLGTQRSRGVAVKPQPSPKTAVRSCTSLSEARFRRHAAMMDMSVHISPPCGQPTFLAGVHLFLCILLPRRRTQQRISMCLQVIITNVVATQDADLFKHTLLTHPPAVVRSWGLKNLRRWKR